MKAPVWLCIVAAAFAAGWGGERAFSKRGEKTSTLTGDVKPQRRGEAGGPVPSAHAGKEEWAVRIRERPAADMGTLVQDIPASQLGAALEAWLGTLGIGGLQDEDESKAQAILDAMAAADFDAAFQWAQGRTNPALRELALKGLAGAIAESDPERAFDCLISTGAFRDGLSDPRLADMMQTLSEKALRESPEKLAELWARLPPGEDSVKYFSGIRIAVPEGTDFRHVMNILLPLSAGANDVYFPIGVMEQWAQQDAEAATRYLLEKGGQEKIGHAWSEMAAAMKKQGGAEAAAQWTADLLRQVPDENLAAFYTHAEVLTSPSQILKALPVDLPADERDRIAAGLIQATADRNLSSYTYLFSMMDPGTRQTAVERVRGVTNPAPLTEAMRQQGWSAEEIQRITKQITQPK